MRFRGQTLSNSPRLGGNRCYEWRVTDWLEWKVDGRTILIGVKSVVHRQHGPVEYKQWREDDHVTYEAIATGATKRGIGSLSDPRFGGRAPWVLIAGEVQGTAGAETVTIGLSSYPPYQAKTEETAKTEKPVEYLPGHNHWFTRRAP